MEVMNDYSRFVVVSWLPACLLLLGAAIPPVAAGMESRAAFPLERLSSGALMRLDRHGDLVTPPAPAPRRKLGADAPLEAWLNPRVGSNTRLGDDPEALPATMRGQAEPHIARDPRDPDILVAVFQEGRYAGPGAVTCGYAVSRDGGLTWSRSLIPRLTLLSDGPYHRATDPVAAIDGQGWMYLNTLGALDSQFDTSALLVSRSTNGGASFEPPVEVARSEQSGTLIDKNWMAINTFPGTPHYGRIVTTFTFFGHQGYPQGLVYSDDHGLTWSSWKFVTPVPFYAQGNQPVFLPDGMLAVVHWNFDGPAIEVRCSTNGGESFTFSNRVARVNTYSAPELRDGSFLPSACGNRTNNSLYVTWQGLLAGQPRVLFSMSTNAGVNWSDPVAVSDNPAGSQVANPAIAASPDGSQLSVVFYDGRRNPSNQFLLDLYLAFSTDGGATWQPNMRLSTHTTDMRLAPLTGGGYMLGDYMGLAPADGRDVPAVAVFVDTRTGDPDPFVARAAISPKTMFHSWRAARFSHAEILGGLGAPGADAEGDGQVNAVEYAFGLNPKAPDHPERHVTFYGSDHFAVSRRVLAESSDVVFSHEASADLESWEPQPPNYTWVSSGAESPFKNLQDVFVSGPGTGKRFFRLKVGLRDP